MPISKDDWEAWAEAPQTEEFARRIHQYEVDATECILAGQDLDLNRGKALAFREVYNLIKECNNE